VALLAIHLCKTLGLNRVHLEGDAQVVINALNSLLLDWIRVGLSVKISKLSYNLSLNGGCHLFGGKVIRRHILWPN
jgi:ribonuclease HI